jgi:4-amino-4-deoxy-L-arabinose transferase-like glycosyltransferase
VSAVTLPRARSLHPQAIALPLLLAGAVALRFAGLGRTTTDPYYDAAVRSMGSSWHGFLFGAYDPGGTMAVDKPPVELWLQVASTKLFGFTTGALLLPGVLGGCAAVLALYALLRRLFAVAEAIAGAAALAVLPISVLTSRSDTMDSVAAALSLAAALLVVRAARSDGRWALAGAGALIGLAFAVKVFQALLPVPALVVLYLAASPLPLRQRLTRLAPAAGVAVAVGLCWLAVVTAAPGRLQPWAIGSTNGSAVDATFVYNGVDRLDAAPARARALPAAVMAARPDPPGPLRLTGAGASLDLRLGVELVPAVLAGLAALLVVARPAPRLARAGALMLGAWLLTGLVVLSAMRGLEARYLEAVAPAVAGTLGVGVVTVARRMRAPVWAAGLAIAALLVIPLQQSVAVARTAASDSGHIGEMPAAEVARLSDYLRSHDHGARYEVASATAVKAAPLIARDGRPLLLLDALARQPVVPLDRMLAEVRDGNLRYLLMTAGCRAGRCGQAVAWAQRNGADVTRRAGLPGRGLLYALPAARARTALRARAGRAASPRASAGRARGRSRARARSHR